MQNTYSNIFAERLQRLLLNITSILQARNQGFFRAGEFSWNHGTLINIHLQENKEKPSTEKSPIFLPRNF